MSEAPFVESKIVGFFEPDFVADGPVLMTLEEGARGMLDPEEIPPTRIYDARHLQASAAGPTSLDEAGFFEEHGFVLLHHESAVEDWDADPLQPESDLTRVYLAEIETLIRTRLLPGRAIDLWQAPPMRRGPGTPNPLYAGGVHQDFGLTPDDYQETIEAFTGAEVWTRKNARAASNGS